MITNLYENFVVQTAVHVQATLPTREEKLGQALLLSSLVSNLTAYILACVLINRNDVCSLRTYHSTLCGMCM